MFIFEIIKVEDVFPFNMVFSLEYRYRIQILFRIQLSLFVLSEDPIMWFKNLIFSFTSSHHRCSVFYKKGVLKNFASLFCRPALYCKETLPQVFSCEFYKIFKNTCEFCEIFKNTFFTEHQTTTSVLSFNLWFCELTDFIC